MDNLPTSTDVLETFRGGMDTYDMSLFFGVPEFMIYHLLWKAKRNDPHTNRLALTSQCKQIMEDKRERAGLSVPQVHGMEESSLVVRVNTGKKPAY